MNRKILALAIPNIISNITIPLVGMVDLAIVGRLGSDIYIGALAIGATIFNFIYWNFAFLRMGTSGFTAQAYGARNFPEMISILVRSLVVGAGFALLLVILQAQVGRFAFMMMNGSDTVRYYAELYFYARIWAAPANLLLFAFMGWFIGMQNSRFPMFISIFINILNLIFGLWFTFGLGMGVRGVAWGTVVAQYGGLMMAVGIWLFYYGRLLKYLDLRNSLHLKSMLRFFSVNRDIFLRTACIVAVYTFFTSASSGMGDTLLAVNTLLMQLFTLFSFMMDGFAYAGEALSGRYVGSGNEPMLRKTVNSLLIWGLGVALLFTTLYGLFWRPALGIFTSSPAIVEGAGAFVFWVMLIPLVAFFPFSLDGILIGATRTGVMRNSVFLSTALFFGSYYALHLLWDNHALWFAFVLFLVSRGVLQYVMTDRLNIMQPAVTKDREA